MSKRHAAKIEDVRAWLRRGDGQGAGKTFRPFLHVRDVPSRGRSAIDLGLKTSRAHHYLSDVEYGYFLLAEYSPYVRDIREQYALLPWEETQDLAKRLAIGHPLYVGSRVPRVLTSDLVLTMEPPITPQYIVISCKVSTDLDPSTPSSRRTLELLLLEKTYWSRRPARWILGTDEALPKNKVFNLNFLRTTMQSRERDGLNSLIPPFTQSFEANWSPHLSMNELLFEVARQLRLTVDEAFTLLGRAVWLNYLPVDLDANKLAHEQPVPLKYDCDALRPRRTACTA
jgi:hypothetical protein